MLISTAGPTWAGGTVFSPAVVRTSRVKGFIFKQVGVSSQYMRHLLLLSFCGGLFLTHLSADTYQIQYQVTSIGTDDYQYTYYVSDLTGNFLENQEVDIEFDPTLYAYGSLSNATGPSGWDLSAGDGDLVQPNTVDGNVGEFAPYYLDSTQTNNMTFTLDVAYSGTGEPGAQSFIIDQFNSAGTMSSSIGSGTTSLLDPTPEPANVGLSGIGLLVLAVCAAVRRTARRTA